MLGDLLYKISGLSGKMSTESEEDDNFGTEAAHQTLLKRLGKDCRDRVFAGLYMGRYVDHMYPSYLGGGGDDQYS